MTSLNVLYYSLAVGFLVLVGFLSYAAFNLSQTLKESTLILKKIDDIAKDAKDLKNAIKGGIQFLINMFSSRRPLVHKTPGPEGGDKNGK